MHDGTLLPRQFPLLKALETPGGMKHPGILHFYCHLMELSPDPLAALPAADSLRTLYPHASHLTHMASHIDIWAGQYKASIFVVLVATLALAAVADLALAAVADQALAALADLAVADLALGERTDKTDPEPLPFVSCKPRTGQA